MESRPQAGSGEAQATEVLTFLIADVRGYTYFTREHGDAEAARLARRFADLARDAVEARGGRVIELRGDEALAAFSSPSQAVRAALEFQATCEEEVAVDPSLPLLVGIGIDAGEAVPVEEGYRGAALNLAARLCSTAAGGEVIVTRTIVEAVASASVLRFDERGTAELKGFEHPVELFAAQDATAEQARPLAPITLEPGGGAGFPIELDALTPLVDREHEMRWLRGIWRQVRRGHGRVLFVSGETQIGKTRLAAEIASHLQALGEDLRYAGPGGTATADALAAIRTIAAVSEPTTLVLDDFDTAGEGPVSALAEAFDAIGCAPAMVLALVHDPNRDTALADLITRADADGDGHRKLPPLGADGVRDIAKVYAGDDLARVPLESIARSSDGIPGRVHEVMSEWARTEATRRLAAAAEWIAAGRTRRNADLEFANNVIGLKLGALYSIEEPTPSPDASALCPYKGLASFEAADAASFFGRERLVGELAARTVEVGMLGVVGASGSGKSSVVAAGLLPSLRAGLLPGSERWRSVAMRPGEHPLAELGSALLQLAGAEGTLGTLLTTIDPTERLVLFVDQFEEVFTACSDEDERAGFIAELAGGARDSPNRLVVVLALRGDFYGECANFEDLAGPLTANTVLVGPMSAEEIRRAIELPARRAGLRVESSLIDALTAEVIDEPGGLPLLSTTLVELWHERSDGWMRMEAYAATGGVRGAVARLADGTYDQLTAEQRERARGIFLRLTGPGEGEAISRRRAPLAEFDLDRDEVAAVVMERLTRDRLVTVSGSTVEVAHEALLREWPRLRGWIEEDAQGQQLHQHLIQAANQWDASGREDSELYRGARLSAMLDWTTGHERDLNELEREFVSDSREASERESTRIRKTNRRLRGLLVGVATFLIVALLAGTFAFVQRGRARYSAASARRSATDARAAATSSEAQRLGAQALVTKDPALSLLLAREGVRLNDSVATQSNMLTDLLNWNAAIAVIHPNIGDLSTTDISADGRWLVAGAYLGPGVNETRNAVIDLRTMRTVRTMKSDWGEAIFAGTNTLVVKLDPSPDGSATIEGLDPLSGSTKWTLRAPSTGGVLTRDDATWLSFSHEALRYFDTATGELTRTIAPPSGFFFHFFNPFAPDGRHFLVAYSSEENLFSDLPGPLKERSWFFQRWSIDGLTPERTFRVPITDGDVIQSSTDLSAIAVGRADGTIDLYDASTGGHDALFNSHGGGGSLRFSHDGRMLASAAGDGSATIFDIATHRAVETFTGHTAPVNAVSFSADGTRLYTASQDGSIVAWDLSGDTRFGRQLPTNTSVGTDYFPNFAISLDGNILAATRDVPNGDVVGHHLDQWPGAHIHGSVILSSLSTGKEIAKINAVAYGVAFSPDGEMLATAGTKGEVVRWDARTGAQIGKALPGPPSLLTPDMWNGMWAVAFSPDGTLLAAGGEDGRVYLWDANTGAAVGAPLVAPPDAVPDTDFSSSNIQPTDAAVVGKYQIVRHITFSSDGSMLAEAVGGSIVVWKMADRSKLAMFNADGGKGSVYALAFSPDSELLATGGGDDHKLRLWNTRSWAEVGSPLVVTTGDSVVSVAFDATGKTVVTAGGGGAVRIIDVAADAEIGPPLPGAVGLTFAAFAPDGRHVVAGDGLTLTFVWDVNREDWAAHACQVAATNLTREEWTQYLPDRPYEAVCPATSS